MAITRSRQKGGKPFLYTVYTLGRFLGPHFGPIRAKTKGDHVQVLKKIILLKIFIFHCKNNAKCKIHGNQNAKAYPKRPPKSVITLRFEAVFFFIFICVLPSERYGDHVLCLKAKYIFWQHYRTSGLLPKFCRRLKIMILQYSLENLLVSTLRDQRQLIKSCTKPKCDSVVSFEKPYFQALFGRRAQMR